MTRSSAGSAPSERRWKSLSELAPKNQRVLTRVDFNVPIAHGRITDATRIERTAPTIEFLLERHNVPILMTHLGRPESSADREFSVSQLAPAIKSIFGADVIVSSSVSGAAAMKAVQQAKPNQLVLLENLRFDAREIKNDPGFAAELASLGSVYCNDAFSVLHRSHSSVDALAGLLPSCAGMNLERELNALESALGNPARPLTAVVGGAKISTKINLLENLLRKVDALIIGGAMANTFLLAQGHSVGTSLAEPELVATALSILDQSRKAGCELVLPIDIVVAGAFRSGVEHITVSSDACPADMMILDIGHHSIQRIQTLISNSRTLIWNGPFGAFEVPPFDQATNVLARFAAEKTRLGELYSVAGGGDTTAALKHAGSSEDFTYVSTAGGAFLEWLEGGELAGIAALCN